MPFKKEKSRFNSRSSGPPFRGERSSGRPAGNRDRPSFNRQSSSGGRGGLELFQATCERCHRDCEVPFKPTNGKPVYCRDCFKKNDSPEPQRNFSRSAAPSHSSDDLDEINEKLDKIMRALKID